MDNTENSNRKEGFIGSFIFHLAILAIFFFFVLKTPNPPLSEGGSGIELNYGTFDEGYGDVQTLNNPSPSPSTEPATEPEAIQPVPETPTPPQTVQTPADPLPANTSDPKEAVEEMATTEAEEDVAIETKKKEAPKKEKIKDVPKEKTEVKKVEKKVEKPVEKKEVKKVSEPKDNPKTDNSKTNNTATKEEGGNNNGDKPGKVGDQGNPEGTLNAKALYGNPGSGGEGAGGSGGNKLDLTGWKLAFKIDKKDITNENGKIVYQIKVDDKGDLVSILPIEKTVSPAVEKFYRQQIEDNWAVDRTKENINPPPIATGKYTVFVRSK